MKEKILSFKNSDGIMLHGIMHEPVIVSQEKNGVAVILVHSGIRGRVGTGRQYVYYARSLAQMGYYVFRFDSYGMGDSEGDIAICSSKTYYRSIQTGRYSQDTEDAIKYVKKEFFCVDKIVLIGLCGGAITSLVSSINKKINRCSGIIECTGYSG